MERTAKLPARKERRYRWGLPIVSAVAAVATLAACGGKSNSAEKTSLPSAQATATGDPLAYRCDVSPNPNPGTYEECPIPNGGIADNGVPVFRYTNLSKPEKPVPYSATQPTAVVCRIPEEALPAQPASLNGGGEYVLGGEYKGHAVAAADVFYNPSMPAHELPYDNRVKLCSKSAIAAVTAP